MLKSFIIAILIVGLTINLNAQEEKSKLSWAADLGTTYSVINISQRTEFQLGVLASYKRHQFRVAPIIQLWTSEAASDQGKIPLTGVALNYFYYIPTESKRFELFFKYEMAIQFFNNSWEANYYNPDINGYESYSDESQEVFFSNSIAYGFTYKPTSNIFLRLDTGGGLYISSIKGNSEGFNELTDAQYDFRSYDDDGWFLKFSFSTGFVF